MHTREYSGRVVRILYLVREYLVYYRTLEQIYKRETANKRVRSTLLPTSQQYRLSPAHQPAQSNLTYDRSYSRVVTVFPDPKSDLNHRVFMSVSVLFLCRSYSGRHCLLDGLTLDTLPTPILSPLAHWLTDGRQKRTSTVKSHLPRTAWNYF